MNYSGEVLIYLQKVKTYFQNDDNAREYFLIDINENFFYKNVGDIAQENFNKKGDAILSIEQFDSIRNQMVNLEFEKSIERVNTNNNKIFIDHNGYPKICLN